MNDKTVRYCGQYRIDLELTDDGYDALVFLNRRLLYTCALGIPEGISVDSPEAFDSAAHAAMSFFANESAFFDEDLTEPTLTGWHIRRPKPETGAS